MIEMLIATLMMVVGIVAMAQLVPLAIHLNAGNRDDSTALVLAQRELDEMLDQPITSKMLAEKDGPIGRLIFNNPARHNAVSLEMWQAVAQIMEDFENDDAIRVIVVSGAGGKAFVSGADISEFKEKRANEEAAAAYIPEVNQPGTRMASIAVRPTWVGVLDFQTRFPNALPERLRS